MTSTQGSELTLQQILRPHPFSGKDLREFRHHFGLSMADTALLIGVSKNTIARWERGELGMRYPQLIRFFCAVVFLVQASHPDLLVSAYDTDVTAAYMKQVMMQAVRPTSGANDTSHPFDGGRDSTRFPQADIRGDGQGEHHEETSGDIGIVE